MGMNVGEIFGERGDFMQYGGQVHSLESIGMQSITIYHKLLDIYYQVILWWSFLAEMVTQKEMNN